MLRKLFLMAIAGLFLTGCASIKESEWAKHKTHYKNLDHLKYSWFGYQNPTPETGKKSKEQGWWGKPVEGP